jgi:sigma-B regulation protein RsbU (phosphoserine phosphatase)
VARPELVPVDEAARIAAVRRLQVLDTPPDGVFDRIAAIAARTFDVPIGIVSVVDTDRIWFKAHHGLEVTEIGRDPGLCASAILGKEAWVVTDASVDPRTLANPLVASDFGLRFYVGVPLTTSDGFNLGTLCVLDTQPRQVTETELATLTDLAAVVVDELELRLASRLAVEAETRLRREAERTATALQASLLPPRPPSLPGMELATRYLPGVQDLQVGGDFFDVWRLSANDWAIVLGDACGKGPRAASLAALARWSVRAASVHHFGPARVLADLNTVLRSEGDEDDHFCSVVFARLELDACGAWVTLAVAGHPLPTLVRATGKTESRGLANLPVGMFDSLDAVDDRVGLGPGDALVFYTDGITEARNATGDQFGEDRLNEVIAGTAGGSADDIAAAIVDAAQSWCCGQPADDVAILVVRVPGQLGEDRVARVADATGVPAEELQLPGYPHDSGPPSPR